MLSYEKLFEKGFFMSHGFPLHSSSSGVSDMLTDYSRCEAEILDKTGAFQSSGAVLVLDAQTHTIVGMSQNWGSISGLLSDAWPESSFALTDLLRFPVELTQLEPEQPVCLTPTPALQRHRKAFELQAHLNGDYLFIEWVYTPAAEALLQAPFQTELPAPEAARASRRNIYQTLQQFCEHLQEALSLDRVMVYQFDADHSGDVVAESCRPDWTPYLGLHYPASDIPQVARDMYLKVPLRHICDAMAPVSGLLTLPEHPALAIDLSACSLRSVSPYHLTYLQNMGVRATLSVAIRYEGKLWGLIACHHGQPLHLTLQARQYVLDAVSQLEVCLSDWLAFRAVAEQNEQAHFYAAQQEQLKHIAVDDGLATLESLLLGDYSLAALLQADATAIYVDGAIVAAGNTPDPAWISDFVKQWTQSGTPESGEPDLFVSHRLQDEAIIPPLSSSENAGLMALRVCDSPSIVLLAFRQEFLHEVHWGGNPYRDQDPGEPLSPRRSFQLWKETVRHQARAWTSKDRLAIQRFKALLRERFSPPQLQAVLTRGTRELMAQLRQHSYIAKILGNSADSGLAMTVLESSEAPAKVLHLNPSLQKVLDTPVKAEAAAARSVEDTLFDLGLTQAQVNTLGAIPQRIKVWLARRGHRVVKMSRRKILSFYIDQTQHAMVAFQFFDVTAEERVENSLQAAYRQANQADAAKLKFLKHTSNELMSPLKEVQRLSNGLHTELSHMGLDDLLLYTDKIGGSSQQMLSRVEQLLFFARSASGHMLLDLEPVDLQALLQECVDCLKSFALKQGVDIKCEAFKPMIVSGNQESLRHMLMNLLDNAVRYSHTGALVFCRLRQNTPGDVFVEIEDQGKGMTEHELAQVFTPYYTGEAQSQGKAAEGTGLGLTLVKHVVEAHRGQIDRSTGAPRCGFFFRKKTCQKSWI